MIGGPGFGLDGGNPDEAAEQHPDPETETDLMKWLGRLPLPRSLILRARTVVAHVIRIKEKNWEQSKKEALQAQAQVFADKLSSLKSELSHKDATVSSISVYFEGVVLDLFDKSHLDPKTKLMNFAWFTHRLESFLSLGQSGRWCAVGLVDIAGFKWYNDALGHQVGDVIIERIADILREQVRSEDLLAHQQRMGEEQSVEQDRRTDADWLHSRLGGDEYCFLIPDLTDYHQAYIVSDRFREAVASFNWAAVNPGLAERPPRVDVGVVCLWLGPMAERRFIKHLVADLIQRADKLMYEAKGQQADHIYLERVKIVNSELADVHDGDDLVGD